MKLPIWRGRRLCRRGTGWAKCGQYQTLERGTWYSRSAGLKSSWNWSTRQTVPEPTFDGICKLFVISNLAEKRISEKKLPGQRNEWFYWRYRRKRCSDRVFHWLIYATGCFDGGARSRPGTGEPRCDCTTLSGFWTRNWPSPFLAFDYGRFGQSRVDIGDTVCDKYKKIHHPSSRYKRYRTYSPNVIKFLQNLIGLAEERRHVWPFSARRRRRRQSDGQPIQVSFPLQVSLLSV